MPKYNHLFALGFSVDSDHELGEDIDEWQVLKAIEQRLYSCYRHKELCEAVGVGAPMDTFEYDEEDE